METNYKIIKKDFEIPTEQETMAKTKRTLIQIGRYFYLLPKKPVYSVDGAKELKELLDSKAYYIRLLQEDVSQ